MLSASLRIVPKVLAEGGVLYANTIGVLSPFAVVACEWIIGSSTSLNVIKIIAMIMAIIGMTLLFIDASKVSGWQENVVPKIPNLMRKQNERTRVSLPTQCKITVYI